MLGIFAVPLTALNFKELSPIICLLLIIDLRMKHYRANYKAMKIEIDESFKSSSFMPQTL